VVGVAQTVELLVVVQAVAGSSPVAHPEVPANHQVLAGGGPPWTEPGVRSAFAVPDSISNIQAQSSAAGVTPAGPSRLRARPRCRRDRFRSGAVGGRDPADRLTLASVSNAKARRLSSLTTAGRPREASHPSARDARLAWIATAGASVDFPAYGGCKSTRVSPRGSCRSFGSRCVPDQTPDACPKQSPAARESWIAGAPVSFTITRKEARPATKA
jgi:hypothetical protein